MPTAAANWSGRGVGKEICRAFAARPTSARCSHHAEVKPATLIWRYGQGALFSTLERRKLCTSCDRGGPMRLEIHNQSRN
ncbi:hypothetical protein MPLB_1700043 [Mesorhizobium sp. ORS 3324]|nr:hypothetical protein MPLB_1700043 [Mesorhizobium sp. ORS 3324]